jgi:hypothetical protein
MRRLVPFVVVIAALVVVSCSSSSPTTSSSGSSGSTNSPARAAASGVPSGAGLGNALGGDPTLGIHVPDAFTSLSLTPLAKSTFPFLGSDGKYHVAYNVAILNVSAEPATLDKVEIVDAADATKVIASYAGKQLVDPTCPYGDCNRLRYIYSGPVQDNAIPIHESRLLYVDFTFDSLAAAPKAVLHHVYLTGKDNLTSKHVGAFDYLATPYNISAAKPRVISPPLKGKNWVPLNGCCEPGFPHRDAILPADGVVGNSQTFAIDWKQTNDAGAFYEGDKTKNESYFDYGEPVYAVADATVVAVLDGVEANPPGVQPTQDPTTAANITLQNVDGNHVILDLGRGVWAMYAHFQKGSLKVKAGDHVKKGDELALLGNTGNANASHLHLQLMDGPNILTANGLPYVFDSFTYRGQVPLQSILDADNYLTGTFFPPNLPAGKARTDQRPLNLDIIDFPT